MHWEQRPRRTAYDAATRTITFTPNAPLNGFVKYTATLSGTDMLGNPVTTDKTWSFTTAKPPAAPGVCPCTLFDDITVPTRPRRRRDGTPVTLGRTLRVVAGRPDHRCPVLQGGRATPAPTSARCGGLNGTALATGTFTGESTSGWQTAHVHQAGEHHQGHRVHRVATGRPPGPTRSHRTRSPQQQPVTLAACVSPPTPAHSPTPTVSLAPVGAATTWSTRCSSRSAPEHRDHPPGARHRSRRRASRDADQRRSSPAPLAAGYSLTVERAVRTHAVAGRPASLSDGRTRRPSRRTPAAAHGRAGVTVTLAGVTIHRRCVACPLSHGPSAPMDPTTSAAHSRCSATRHPPPAAAIDALRRRARQPPSRPANDGKVTAIRFFKGAGNGGTHIGFPVELRVGHLVGQRHLRRRERLDGWQTAKLALARAGERR